MFDANFHYTFDQIKEKYVPMKNAQLDLENRGESHNKKIKRQCPREQQTCHPPQKKLAGISPVTGVQLIC